jgi:thioredoxin-dependent peroxiredoxin
LITRPLARKQHPANTTTQNTTKMMVRTIITLCAGLTVAGALSLPSTPTTTKIIDGRRAFLQNAVVAAATLAVGASPSLAADTVAATGSKAPFFELPNSRGNGLTSLDNLVKTGKWTVLYFYPGAFTEGCTLEARGFQRDYDDYMKLNTQVVGVSVDDVKKNASFCSEEKLDFFMLSDKGGIVSKMYGSALSIPGFGTLSNRQTYLIDPKGNIQWVFTDVESRVARHSAEVLDKLAEIQMKA